MPLIVDNRELELPRELPLARQAFNCPDGECFGCFLGDDGLELHDIPDACQYLGGFVFDLS